MSATGFGLSTIAGFIRIRSTFRRSVVIPAMWASSAVPGPDQWIGKSFLAALCTATSVRPGSVGYEVKGAAGVQLAMVG